MKAVRALLGAVGIMAAALLLFLYRISYTQYCRG
jgi:hypothetical protein